MATEDTKMTNQPASAVQDAPVNNVPVEVVGTLAGKVKKRKRGIGYRIVAGVLITLVISVIIIVALFGIALAVCGQKSTNA